MYTINHPQQRKIWYFLVTGSLRSVMSGGRTKHPLPARRWHWRAFSEPCSQLSLLRGPLGFSLCVVLCVDLTAWTLDWKRQSGVTNWCFYLQICFESIYLLILFQWGNLRGTVLCNFVWAHRAVQIIQLQQQSFTRNQSFPMASRPLGIVTERGCSDEILWKSHVLL